MMPIKLIPLCGLFQKLNKNGKVYYSGQIGNCKIYVFQNDQKENGGPEFNLVLGPPIDTSLDWKRKR